MIEMIVGAGIAIGGVIVGKVLPNRRKGPNPKKAECGCTHHLAMHDPQTRECHATIAVPVYNTNSPGTVIDYEYKPCACMQYVGPPAE